MRQLVPTDIFAFRHADMVRITGDGRRLAYLEVRRDIDSDRKIAVLKLSVDGGQWVEVAGSEGASIARWAPDGLRLAFLRRCGENSAVVVVDTATGGRTELFETAAALRELAWSPDGAMLAFQTMVETGAPAWAVLPTPPKGANWAPAAKITARTVWRHDPVGELPHGDYQVMVVPAAGGVARQITNGPWMSGMFHPAGLVWSADGNEVLLAAIHAEDWDTRPDETAIYGVRVADGAVRQLTEGQGAAACPTPSPDGRWIAYVAGDSAASGTVRKLRIIPAAGGAARVLTPALDRSVDLPVWDPTGGALFVAVEVPGGRHIARIGLNGDVATLTEHVGGPGIEMPYPGGGFSVAADGTLAFVVSTSEVPSDVAVQKPGEAVRLVTSLNAGIAAEVGGFRPVELLEVPASTGSHTIQGWLMQPAAPPPAGGHPLILEIHGGPFAQYGTGFAIKHQMLAAAGYAVLFVNPRGSTGRGEEFAAALRGQFPGPDHEDLMDVLDVAVARADIDAGNLFITGVSGGGVLTCWAVAHTHRFRAAVSIKPVVDWQSWTLTADIGALMGPRWLGNVQPWEDAAKYRARSPLTYAENIRTPTMLIAGEADSRTPPTEALQMYTALRLRGVETALMRLPGASHSSAAMRPSHIASEVSVTLGWFGRFRLI